MYYWYFQGLLNMMILQKIILYIILTKQITSTYNVHMNRYSYVLVKVILCGGQL